MSNTPRFNRAGQLCDDNGDPVGFERQGLLPRPVLPPDVEIEATFSIVDGRVAECYPGDEP